MSAEFKHSFHILVSFQLEDSLLRGVACCIVSLYAQCTHDICVSYCFECFVSSKTKKIGFVFLKKKYCMVVGNWDRATAAQVACCCISHIKQSNLNVCMATIFLSPRWTSKSMRTAIPLGVEWVLTLGEEETITLNVMCHRQLVLPLQP
jgi:hypothetical protein